MLDLIVRGGRVIDPLHQTDEILDLGVEDGKIVCQSEEITEAGKQEVNACGKLVIPGIIDMHTHMRTELGHPHAQRMVAKAGVCTTLDMAGPLENILSSIPGSGSGINIAILEAARAPLTISSNRPDAAERNALIERTLEHGGIGIKLLGGHFPMDLDICSDFISDCSKHNCWVGWHVGNSKHGSNIEGFRDAIEAANGNFLHIAHINSYCRGQVSNETEEALEAIESLKQNPNIFAESYLSPLNGTRLTIQDDIPSSKVTVTCLRKVGCDATYAGMEKAILKGLVGVLANDGQIGKLIYGQEGLDYWKSEGTNTTGCFSVNPAVSRFLLATAKRNNGSFVVDSFSTDGGCYPRNVIVQNGLLLVKFGALTLREFVIKSSLNGAIALGLKNKGHLGIGADADISILDYEKEDAYATVVNGKVIMLDGQLMGKSTQIICEEVGREYLQKRGISTIVKAPLQASEIPNRYIP